MRAILDTNILIAALISRASPPNQLYEAWRDGRFTLIISDPQIEEFQRVTRRDSVRALIHPVEAGRMLNDIRRLAITVGDLPQIEVSPDPYDNFLLAMAQISNAELLVTGDKRGLLALQNYRGTRIVTARQAIDLLTGKHTPAH